jgi:acetyl coenzyme A synthetase (ADP forming)-like protein
MSPTTTEHAFAAADVALRDGSTVRIRAVEPRDEPALRTLLEGLSERSRALRFAGALSAHGLARQAARLARPEVDGSFGVVATAAGGRVVGHAEYGRTGAARAEVALMVADAWQGRGLGTAMLGQLAEYAQARGIHTFEAYCLPENHRMLRVFRESGFPTRVHAEPGEVRVEFPTDPTGEARERYEARDAEAAMNAVAAFFRPRSVAVVGASREPDSIGARVMENLLGFGYEGPVYPVNPKAEFVHSVLAYPSLEAVPGPVDLAVVIVPAPRVLEVVVECGRKGVRAVLVISAGFAEAGEEGRARQAELLRLCRASGMRLIGPNCMGVLNTHPAVRLNATFAPAPPPAGRIGFMSQSGALGLAIMEHASRLGLGLSSFASVGNKADLSGNDLLRYWERDGDTDLILLYLESFGNPRNFARIARRVSRTKPIVAVKSGRSAAGARASGSHTGALVASADRPVDALFRQAGVIRTDTLEEMFDVAAILTTQPAPRGRRVAILTNAGGPGILCADACVAEGLEVPTLSDATRAALGGFLPAEAGIANPVDIIASATPEQYRRAIEAIGVDPGVDALVVIYVPPIADRTGEIARAILDGARSLGGALPVLTVFMQAHGTPEALREGDLRLPSYVFPENAAIALARVARYGEWRATPQQPPAAFDDLRLDEAAAVVAAALADGERWLTPREVAALLACFGIPVVEERLAASPEEAVAAAEELGGEVVLKAVAPGLVHKSERGAVRVRLAPDAVEGTAREMDASLRAGGLEPTDFLVQRMAPEGVEMLVGVTGDPLFGPVVACGAGGALVELMNDVAVRLAPLSEADAEEMIRELRSYRRLEGYRGAPPVDVPALREVILRVGALAEALPHVAELDLNPVVVHPSGATVVDARVRVAPAGPRRVLPTRRG